MVVLFVKNDMKNYSKVYKAYDLRSIYNDPMDSSFAYSLWKWMGTHFVKEYWVDADFLLWCDTRTPNKELLVAFICGLEDAGCKKWVSCNTAVESLWEQDHSIWVSSTAFFYRCMFKTFHLGAIFTASHNPPERVGMKNANSSASLLPSHELEEMVDGYVDFPYEWDKDTEIRIVTKLEQFLIEPDKRITKKWKEYVDLMAEQIDEVKKPYKIIVDYSWWACVWYEYAFFELLAQESNIEILHLNECADATFSAHLSDTNQPSSFEQVWKAVRKHKADFGVMFDGDGDRLWVVDEDWWFVSWDILVPLIAKSLLATNPWRSVVYDITCTNSAPDIIKETWWTAYASKVWYRNVKWLMKKVDAIFWWELSGHLLFPETWYAESPLLALVYIFQTLDTYETFSAMVADNTRWVKQPVTNYTVEDKLWAMQAIKEAYSDYSQNELDGIRIDWSDWWFLVRASNTEPKLRTYIEARTQEKVDEIRNDIEQYFT